MRIRYDVTLRCRESFKALDIGYYVMRKYRKLARESSYGAVARNLRKQGYPLEVTLEVLGINHH